MKYIIFYIDNTVSKIFNTTTDDSGNPVMSLSSHNNFVAKDEIIARIIDVETPEDLEHHIDEGMNFHVFQKFIPVKAGEGISLDKDTGIFRAQDYGFAVFETEKGQITLLPLLRIQKDKMKAFYIIHPAKSGKIPTVANIEENLIKLKIYTITDKNTLESQLSAIDTSKPEVHKIKVAQGKEPVNGNSEYFIPLIDFEKKAGKILEDGSIDFKEVGSIIEIKQRQAILKRVPQVDPQDGFNIYGEKAEGIMLESGGFSLGENIVPTIDPNIYASQIDGCLEVIRNAVSVSPISIVKGDVGYESGNIDFHGTIHIRGTVLPGFTVKAKGDIIIGGAVSDAVIEAGGDVTVKLGVEGKGLTKIFTGGRLQAKFILNSQVESMGVITVEDSIINSTVFSNEKVVVTGKHGKIIGGETTALYEIQAKTSGVPNENKTTLAVGKNIIIEKELAELRGRIIPIKTKIEEITQKLQSGYGKEVFSRPKEFIAILPDIKKKACLALLSELSTSNRDLKQLTEEYKEKETGLVFEKDPVILISEKVYPGTQLKIKKSVRLIEEELSNVKFYEDPQDKVIRFSSFV